MSKKKTGHVYIYGEIYPEQSSFASEFGIVSLSSVVRKILDYEVSVELIVHIHSRGGDVNEGFAIYDALKNSKKKIITWNEGLVASIATVPFLAGDTRKMNENAEFFIHNPWNIAIGDADAFEKNAENLRKAEDRLKAFYAEKTGGDVEQIGQLMKDETALTPAQALEMKFSTETIATIKALAVLTKEKIDPMAKKNEQLEKKLQELNATLTNVKNAYKEVAGKEFVSESPKALDLTTEDGRAVHVDTEAEAPAVGDAVTVDGAEAPNAELKMENGSYISTDENSQVKEYKPAEESPENIEEIEVNAVKFKLEKPLAEAVGSVLAEARAEIAENNKTITEILKKSDEVIEVVTAMKNLKSNHTPKPAVTVFKNKKKSAPGEKKSTFAEVLERKNAERERKLAEKNK